MSATETIQLLREKAEAVQTNVVEITSLEEAVEYCTKLCAEREPAKMLIPGATHEQKVIAAPALPEDMFASLIKSGEEKGIKVIKEGMRDHLAGIEIGFTIADGGIAATGTVIQSSNSEEVRIATMVSEAHVVVLPKSKVFADSYDAEELLENLMSTTAYTAFITGPSRTADIERTLALGAHGPLELHMLLLED